MLKDAVSAQQAMHVLCALDLEYHDAKVDGALFRSRCCARTLTAFGVRLGGTYVLPIIFNFSEQILGHTCLAGLDSTEYVKLEYPA